MKARSARIRVNQPGRRSIIDPRCPFPHSAYILYSVSISQIELQAIAYIKVAVDKRVQN